MSLTDGEGTHVILQKKDLNIMGSTSCTASVTIFKTPRRKELQMFSNKKVLDSILR